MLRVCLGLCCLFAGGASLVRGEGLPLERTFRGEATFHRLVALSEAGDWRSLPMGDRVARFGRAMVGIPYRGFTLEIDDRIEAPSVDFTGLDCWTFFEVALGMARMVEAKRPPYRPADLLAQIEHTRYRGGRCTGHYLERIHYLAEWYVDNDRRGTIDDLTHRLGGVPFRGRRLTEMSDLWRSYRYLRENPDLRPRMAALEREISTWDVRYIPTAAVDRIDGRLADGDIIGIATHKDGVFCSHVGLALRGADGRMHLMHASSDRKRVIVDDTLTGYLQRYRRHAGILVARPLPVKPRRRGFFRRS